MNLIRIKQVCLLFVISLGIFWGTSVIASAAGNAGIQTQATSGVDTQGLQVMVKMDKEQYEPDEAITATITVVNTNTRPVTIINLEQLIPEGYMLAEDSQASTQEVEIQPGQSLELKVTYQGDPAQQEQVGTTDTFWDTIFYGETIGIPNIILLVIVVIAIVVFMALT